MFKYRSVQRQSARFLRCLSAKVTRNESRRFFSISPSSRNSEYGVSINFTQEHEEMRKSVRKIIDNDINPYVDQWEEEGIYPAHKIFKKLAEVGVLGITRPTDYGGLGLDYSFTVAFLEELAYINCGGVPMSIAVHTDMTMPALVSFGSEELKQEFLVPSISGDKVSCLGVSEPGAGSDVAGIKTTAVRKGDDLIINGSKMWISNGLQADWMCLLANTSDGHPHRNKSLICIPLNLPGISRNKIEKLGMFSSDTAQFFFEDVRVPAKNIIGEEGMGFTYQMLQFQYERLAGCIGAPVSMERIIQATIEYCRQRKAFGQSILDNQYIHYRLAELQTEVEALRSLIYRASVHVMNGENATLLTTMAKLKAGKLKRELVDSCLQFWGGMGYTKEAVVSRAFRDGRLLSIGGGTDEIMMAIICKFMDILPGKSKKSTK
ncbi:probable acyl-CoA dehydrogenase 6 [Centruroides vittatus]|uniref:probable acyl-CoA dehydrogenase 6 n=1 Tax=Centruroides vittatus TaxID=120091 RepID=UPI0035102F25